MKFEFHDMTKMRTFETILKWHQLTTDLLENYWHIPFDKTNININELLNRVGLGNIITLIYESKIINVKYILFMN